MEFITTEEKIIIEDKPFPSRSIINDLINKAIVSGESKIFVVINIARLHTEKNYIQGIYRAESEERVREYLNEKIKMNTEHFLIIIKKEKIKEL